MKAIEAFELANPVIQATFKNELERVYKYIRKRASWGDRMLTTVVDNKVLDLIERDLLSNGYTVKKTEGRSYNIIIWW